jgi:hypothetical protein
MAILGLSLCMFQELFAKSSSTNTFVETKYGTNRFINLIDFEVNNTNSHSSWCILNTSTTLFVVYNEHLTKFKPSMPLAKHCSLVISAACHPPSSDMDSHFKVVK